MTKSLLLLLLAFSTVRGAGAAAIPEECRPWSSKEAWLWTNEERLEKRLDERCLAARRVVAANEERRDGRCTASGAINDFVFGTDTPELFLPWELFDTLIRRTILADRKFSELQRTIFEQRIRAARSALPADFWQRVENSASEYVEALRVQQRLATGLDSANKVERRRIVTDISGSQRGNCALRAAALERERAAFGAFDQFLYVAVAPGLCSSGTRDFEMSRWVAGGCEGMRPPGAPGN